MQKNREVSFLIEEDRGQNLEKHSANKKLRFDFQHYQNFRKNIFRDLADIIQLLKIIT